MSQRAARGSWKGRIVSWQAVFWLALSGCSSPHIVLVRGGSAGERDRFEARGLDSDALEAASAQGVDWSRVLTVRVVAPGSGDSPAMMGKATAGDSLLRFQPEYALEPGLQYRATLRPGPWLGGDATGASPLEATFTLPERDLEPKTRVERIYPTSNSLPENLLKFYVHFSGPMRRGQAYSRILLIDEAGREVDSPFLELGEELWDRSATRFTLFIDPGRIKRGVKPHEELGPALEAGKRYSLVIASSWLDADGAHLEQAYRKRFQVVDPDYDQPDPGKWRIEAPHVGSVQALRVLLGEPLDHALLLRLLHVRGAGGERLEGHAETSNDEREWSFFPDSPWKRGRHEIVVDTTLEDLAGNSVDRPFEVDTSGNIETRVESRTVKVPFEVSGLR